MTDPAEHADPPDDTFGHLDHLDGRSALRFERLLRHPQDVVWRALTEPDQLAAWFPTTIDGERRAGAPLLFRFPEEQPFEPFEGELLVFDPPHRLALRWGTDELRLELTPTPDGGTRLVLVDLLDEHGKAARDAAGWHACLAALGRHLAGRPDRSVLTTGWERVHARYVKEFGPEAATIGPPS